MFLSKRPSMIAYPNIFAQNIFHPTWRWSDNAPVDAGRSLLNKLHDRSCHVVVPGFAFGKDPQAFQDQLHEGLGLDSAVFAQDFRETFDPEKFAAEYGHRLSYPPRNSPPAILSAHYRHHSRRRNNKIECTLEYTYR